MLSGLEDTLFWVWRGDAVPERWTWASHINVFFGHVVTRGTAYTFMAVHLVLAALILFLPDQFWSRLFRREHRPEAVPADPAIRTPEGSPTG